MDFTVKSQFLSWKLSFNPFIFYTLQRTNPQSHSPFREREMMDWFFCAGPCLGRIKANPASCIFACPATRSADKRSAKLRITEDFECTLQCSALVMVGMRMCLAGFGIDGCAPEWDKNPQKKQLPQSVLSSKEFSPETSFFFIPTQRWEGDLLGNFQREFKGNDRFKFLKRERTVRCFFYCGVCLLLQVWEHNAS
ncbi:hypothetical protein CDAR_443611 [Caerostris darwini]|uniref:Uncharacterized protein n=1 Tax=Caerostris darwini TaxID=1538125 RepID=A0AAV4TT31_9ARAC|nr:hypothetical protein CDAR_443611 [Caerostris darwini]